MNTTLPNALRIVDAGPRCEPLGRPTGSRVARGLAFKDPVPA